MTEPRVPPLLPRSGRVFVTLLVAAVVGVVALGIAVPRAAETTVSAPTPRASSAPTTSPGSDAPETTPGPQSPVAAPSLQPTNPVRKSTEVGGADVGSAADNNGVTPPPPAIAALIEGGVPPSASDLGSLVAGFPAAVPIADGSTIVSSSVDSSGSTVQATVVARTPRSPDEVIALYQTAFAALGLAGSPLQSAAGDRALAFNRDGASVTLTVGADGSGSSYSLLAVITLTP